MQIKQLLNEGKRKLIENNIEDACIQTRTLMQFILNKEQVRSSIARRLGINRSNLVLSDRNIDSIVEIASTLIIKSS